MPINGSGVVSKVSADVAVPGAVVESAKWNDQNDDFVDLLNAMLQHSGIKAMSGALNMGSHKINNLTDGAAIQDASSIKQEMTNALSHAATVNSGGGGVDELWLTFSPANTTLTTNERIRWTSPGENTTTTPTVSKDAGVTDKTIKKGAGSALAVGDTGASGYVCEAEYNGTDWLLLNPATLGTDVSASTTVRGTVELSTAAEYRNDTADRALTGEFVWDAAETVALTWTSGGNTAVDMATGINFTVTAATGDSTLGQPTNTKVGQTGFISITQDSTPRTLAYHADWKFAGGTDPAISTGSGAVDLLFYQVIAANFIAASLMKGLA